jgi:hypothetical protein
MGQKAAVMGTNGSAWLLLPLHSLVWVASLSQRGSRGRTAGLE